MSYAQLDGSDLRRHRPSPEVLFMLVVWMLYLVTSFRLPTSPITLSDSNTGGAMRQLIFAGTGSLAFLRFFVTRSMGSMVGIRRIDFGLAAFLIGSVVWSVSPTLTIKRSLIFLLGLAGLLCSIHMTERPVRVMQRTIVWLTGTVAWLSVTFWFVLPRNCVENPARPGLAGISEHPNTLAPFLVLGFITSLGLVESGRLHLLQRFFQCFQVIGVLLAQSMTSLSQMFLTIGIFVILKSGSYWRGLVQMFFGLFLSLLLIVGPSNFVNGVLGMMGRDASFSGRDELWNLVFIEASKKPIFGHGYGAFWYEGRGRDLVTTWNPRQAHNAYLDTVTDLGLLGLVVVLIAFHGRILEGWLRHRGSFGTQQRLATASLVAMPIGLLTVYGFGQSFLFKLDSFPFFMCFWCVLLLSNNDTNHISAEFKRYDARASRS